MARTFIFWLEPPPGLKRRLRPVINGLARQFGAVSFPPHVTVFVGPSTKAQATAIAHRMARRFKPIKLSAARLDYTPQFFKTLFVQFRPSRRLTLLSETIGQSLRRHSEYKINPHLSLLYYPINEARQRRLCATVTGWKGKYRFATLRVVEWKIVREDAQGVRSFRPVLGVRLRGRN